MSWVVVIGAGPSQVPYIHMLKAWGYSVFATDVDPTAPGFAHTDYHAVVSTYDVEGTWMALQSYRDLEAISAIISPTTGEPLRTVHTLSRRLGLPALKSETVEDLLHKGRLRARLNETAERPLAWGVASTVPEAEKVAKHIGYPVIVKPTRGGMGGRGVSRVDSLARLEPALLSARSIGLSNDVVIEKFVEGQEVSVTGLLYAGEMQFFAVGGSLFDPGLRSLPVGEVMGPDFLPAPLELDVKNAVLSACRTFGLETCPLNIDVILDTERVPHIIEIEFALADALLLTPIACGYDLQVNELRVHMRREPEAQRPFAYSSALRYFTHPAPCARRVCNVEEARALPGVVELVADEPVRVSYHDSEGDIFVWGHVVTRARTGREAEKRAELCKNRLCFVY